MKDFDVFDNSFDESAFWEQLRELSLSILHSNLEIPLFPECETCDSLIFETDAKICEYCRSKLQQGGLEI